MNIGIGWITTFAQTSVLLLLGLFIHFFINKEEKERVQE